MRTKGQNIARIGFFLVLIFGMTAVTLVYPVKEFSERENRSLAQLPEASVEDCFSGKFEKDYEDYLTDQFPFRDTWIGMKTAVEKATFKQETKDIYFAKNGYLIEAHSKSFTSPTASNNIRFLQTFMENCKETYGDGHVTAMVVPNAVDILQELLPAYASPYDESEYLAQVEQAMPEGVWFDSRSVLQGHKNVQLYYKTDHHWTTEAAWYVYEAWAKDRGLDPLSQEDYQVETVTNSFKGTIDAKVGGENASDSIQIYRPKEEMKLQIRKGADGSVTDDIYEESYLDTRDKYSIYFGGNQGEIEVSVENDSARRLLVVKDSYAHCFLPFTFHDFSEVDFVDLRYYNESLKEYMEQGNYTDVLFLYNAAGFAEDTSLIKLGN